MLFDDIAHQPAYEHLLEGKKGAVLMRGERILHRFSYTPRVCLEYA